MDEILRENIGISSFPSIEHVEWYSNIHDFKHVQRQMRHNNSVLRYIFFILGDDPCKHGSLI